MRPSVSKASEKNLGSKYKWSFEVDEDDLNENEYEDDDWNDLAQHTSVFNDENENASIFLEEGDSLVMFEVQRVRPDVVAGFFGKL